MSALRAGLIGAGAMGRNHARVLGQLEDVDFVGISDPALEAGLFGAEVVPDVESLIALGIDYAVVACPTSLHEEVGIALASAGVHALIEKPLASTVDGASALAKAFADAGLVGGVGHIERYNPALQALRTRLEEGELGQIHQVITRRQGPFPHRIADVGVVKDLATHDIDLTAWVTGESYLDISARTVTRSGRPHEDMVAAIGTLSGDIIVNHLVNWLSPMKERCTVITGEKGAYIADTLTADLTLHRNGQFALDWDALSAFRGVAEGDVTRFAIPKREPLLVEHEQFRDAVLGRDADIVTLDQGCRTVQVAQAMIDSADGGGQRVDLA
ncbi:Gfo/Idh/MocA family protein [Aeromicrobium sp. 179-A 4D2 NHS]|uniref:Gfo/Idh/MocA family protein n=1 Tax=Aeromicrobium sp. 179-A 4D2 NHS TaxID=3142375 RepID=UPI0039A00085